MKSKFATVWGWGDEFEDVGRNCEKYVSKRWDENVKECGIDIIARERNEGIHFHITCFTSEREGIRDLAQGMFDVALSAGHNVKVDFVTVELFDSIISDSVAFRKSIKDIKDELEVFWRAIANRFNSDSRIKSAAEGKKVIFFTVITLLCELKPLHGNKMLTEAHHFDLEILKDFLNSVNKKLIMGNLAKEVLGYELHVGEIDDYEVEDIGVRKDEVVVRLERKSLRVGT